MWDGQVAEFARLHRVIRYDLGGLGRSAFPTGPYSNVDDLEALLRFLHVGHASLVGLSMGAMVAEDFALEHPERWTGSSSCLPACAATARRAWKRRRP